MGHGIIHFHEKNGTRHGFEDEGRGQGSSDTGGFRSWERQTCLCLRLYKEHNLVSVLRPI